MCARWRTLCFTSYEIRCAEAKFVGIDADKGWAKVGQMFESSRRFPMTLKPKARGGGGNSLYKLYGYVPHFRVRFSSCFSLT